MRVQRFPIANEDPPRLELRWQGSEAHVYFDGAHAATLDGFAGLKRGWSTELEDGRRLELRTVRRAGFSELSVLVDGEHAPSSPSHPDRILRTSSNVLLVLSAFMIVTGLVGTWGRSWPEVVFGVFYLLGALLLRRGRRAGAAVIAVPMFIRLDLLLLIAITDGIDRQWAIDLGLTVIFASFVVRSYQAARDSRLARHRVETKAG